MLLYRSCQTINSMKRVVLIYVLFVCMFAACNTQEEPHKHIPDDANCQSVQYCADCGEQLAERGMHDYSNEPEETYDGFSFYPCRICGKIKIVNENGAPVVPVE